MLGTAQSISDLDAWRDWVKKALAAGKLVRSTPDVTLTGIDFDLSKWAEKAAFAEPFVLLVQDNRANKTYKVSGQISRHDSTADRLEWSLSDVEDAA